MLSAGDLNNKHLLQSTISLIAGNSQENLSLDEEFNSIYSSIPKEKFFYLNHFSVC